MATLVRTIRTKIPLFTFSTRGLLVFLFIIGAFLALFFLPDFARREGGVQETSQVQTAEQVQRLTPLEEVLAIIENAPPVGARESNFIQSDLRVTEQSWNYLQSDAWQTALGENKAKLNVILGEIPAEKPASREAVTRYGNALDAVQAVRSDEAQLNLALQALRREDTALSVQFKADEIPAPTFAKWSAISLGETMRPWEDHDSRSDLAPRFNPLLTIQWVEVTNVRDSSLDHINPFGLKQQLRFSGVFRNFEVTEIEVFRNGVSKGMATISGKPKRYSFMNFSFETPIIDGTWTLRAKDVNGAIYDKSYTFFPRIRKLVKDSNLRDVNMLSSPDNRLDKLDKALLIKEGGLSSDGLESF